jgi:kynureninase
MSEKQIISMYDNLDPLSKYRREFLISDDGVCYLDGNSLGRMPKRTIDEINDLLINEWGRKMVGGWADWIDEAEQVGNLIGEAALGAAPGQTLALDTNTINIYQLAVAGIKARPGRKKILIDRANFPSDRYALEAIADLHGMELIYIENEDPALSPQEEITLELLNRYLDDDVALVTLQIVQYRSGVLNDYASIEKAVRARGALMLWDCSHSVGSVDLQFDKHGIGLAAGCTYKYGNSGPGAPGWLYVSHDLQKELNVPIRGWFAAKNQFAMERNFEREDGIRGFQISTPPVIGLRAVKVGFEMIKEAGMKAINEKCLKGTDLMIELFDLWLEPLGFSLATPRERHRRCGHIIITHPDGAKIARALREVKNVYPDYREPNGIRFSFSPLPTSFIELYEGFARLRDLVASGEYKNLEVKEIKVT